MTQQKISKIVQHWANNHLVVSGKHCRQIDNYNQKTLINTTPNVFEQFSRIGRVA